MVARNTACDAARLRELLDGTLAEAQQSALIRHVETCSACQQSLETCAAEPPWWDEASRSLRALASAHRSAQNASSASERREDAEPLGACQFVRHYLEPSRKAGGLGRLGEYEVTEIIGRGGMGVVVKGFDGSLNRYVAIKMLSPELASSAAARQRFAREAQAAAAVVHAHVVPIHAVNGQADVPYLVMPFIAGESLQRRIDRLGPLPVRDVLRIAMQAARGLAAAHEQGLVHRDIKPANILLENDVDRVLLTDFGLARAVDDASLTVSGVIAGTPQYMSPEQACGETVDRRSDLFSLGSVMYAMCAGRPPFRAETTMGILHRITRDPPRPLRELNPDVPAWLDAIIQRLLEKDPTKRFASAEEVAELLGQCLAHVQHPMAIELPQVLNAKRPKRIRKWTVVSAAGATLLLAGGLAYTLREPPMVPEKAAVRASSELAWRPLWAPELVEMEEQSRALLKALEEE